MATVRIITFILTLLSLATFAQPGAHKNSNPFHKAYHDSLKSMAYKCPLPFLGKKAYKKGFDIQYPFGMGIAYFAQRQQINISQISVSFNDNAPIDLTDVVQFGYIENKSWVTTIRPNVWVLPFLNVYGIFGTGKSATTVPLVSPVNFTTTQHFDLNSYGLGGTIAGGFNQIIFIADMNYNWANLAAFEKPVPAYNLDLRVGHSFVTPRRADRNITIWAGTFFQQIQADTKGTIYVKDIFPGISDEQKQQYKEDFDQWYETLGPAQKVAVNKMVTEIKDYFDGKSPGNSSITYNLDKKLAGPWNLIFGAQYQHNKHWQLRAEMGTFGKRTQFLLNLNYCWIAFKFRKKA